MSSKDPYALLGLSPDAGVTEVKQAYKQMALKWHPDRHQKDVDKEYAKSVFAELTTAYQTLLRDCERPLTAVGVKLRTRLPTPMPSFKSISEDSPTSASTTDSSHFSQYNSNNGSEITPPSSFSGSLKARHVYDVPARREYILSQATKNIDLHGNHWKPAIIPQARQASPHLPTGPVHNRFRVRSGRANVSPSWARVAMPVRQLNENIQVLKSGPPLQPLSIRGSEEWTYSLPLTLEDLFNGKHCRFCLVRHSLSGRSKNVIIEIDVPSGCRSGTRILCRGVGNELPNGALQDVVFVIEETPHPHFSRIEDDLYLDINLPWTDSLAQCPEKVKIKGIDGKEVVVSIDYARHRMLKGELYVRGAGMPIRDGGRVVGRSDLIIRYGFRFLRPMPLFTSRLYCRWEIQPPPTRIRHFLGRFWHLRTK
ncbi:hypothetical protein C0995_000054 [Termitomyces sp. Mi166|nr:hypothetical protein C0995_000054 [Termitomyces sp. Mi166\